METETKKSSNIIVYIIIGLVFLICGFVVGYFVLQKPCNCDCKKAEELSKPTDNCDCNNDKDKQDDILNITDVYTKLEAEKTEIIADSTNDYTKNIEIINKYVSKDNHSLIIHAKNNNKEAIEVSFDINFYDSEGYNINYSNTKLYGISPEHDFIIVISSYNRKNADTVRYDIKYTANKLVSYYSIRNDISEKDFDVVDINGNIQVTYKNNTKSDVSMISAACIYYKDNKEVFATNAYIGKVAKGATGQGTCFKHIVGDISYDKYKVILINAYDYIDEGW